MKTGSKTIQLLGMSACLFAALVSARGQAAPPQPVAKADSIAAQAEQADPHQIVEREILLELRQIRALLERQMQKPQQPAVAATPAVEKATVSTAGFGLGRKDAPLTIVEFADYQCPFCRQFHNTVFNQLKKDYIDTGKVRFVSRDLPLDFHSNAFAAAQAARCAGDQDKFWEMRESLIAHADSLAPEAVNGYAGQLGIDMQRFHACIDMQTYSSRIRQDVADANAAGISGTPSFVVGPSNGASVAGEMLIGAQPLASFVKLLDGRAD